MHRLTCAFVGRIWHKTHFLMPAHMILQDNQHGFREKRSCETKLIITIQEIASRLAKGKQVNMILLDFEKAFDKVSRGRLLYKLVRPLIHVIFSWTRIGRFGFTDREIESQIGRFFRGKKYSILVWKIVICSTVNHCKMFYLPAYC